MSEADFGRYMLFAAAVFGALGVVNLLRPKRRWLGAGSVLFGAAALLYGRGGADVAAAVPCVLGALCLVQDARTRPKGRRA